MPDAPSQLPTGPFLLRTAGKEVRAPTLSAVRKLLVTEFAGRKPVVIDIASGKRIVFKDQAGSSGQASTTIAAAPHDSPGFFLSATPDIEIVSASDVVIPMPAPVPVVARPAPTPKITRPRWGDATRTPAPTSRKPASPQLIAYVVAGIFVIVAVILLATNGRRTASEARPAHPAPAIASQAPVNVPDSRAVDQRSAPPGANHPLPQPATPVASPPSEAVAAEPGGPGLVAHYPFDDATSIGKDLSVRHRALLSIGGATSGFDPVMRRQVLILLGHSDVRMALPVTRDFTIAVWVTTGVGGLPATSDPALRQWFAGYGLVDADIGGPHADFGTAILNGHFAFGVGDPDTTLMSNSSVSDNKWHHLVASRANSGRMQVYVDGLQEAVCDGPSGDRNAPKEMVIGRLLSGGNFLVARLSHLRFYDRMITDAEVLELVHAEGPAP